MEKAWAIIIDDDQAACMMAIPRLFEQLQRFNIQDLDLNLPQKTVLFWLPGTMVNCLGVNKEPV
ncbi:hypothetical protein [Endozoicomonas atrinae]|uniref:hypothetical protein n=1 Tax=Endozoicomonas atrinae TaxID=1333660 RepID=UPI003B00EF90